MDKKLQDLIDRAEDHAGRDDNYDVAEFARNDVPMLCEVIAEQDKKLVDLTSKINDAIMIALRYGLCEKPENKQWAMDQMIRRLLGSDYERWFEETNAELEGDDHYPWEQGVKP